jgi:hypothetical protein
MTSCSAVKKIGDFPPDSSGGRHATPDNSRCCEIPPTVFAAAKKLNLSITDDARHSSDYSVEMGQGISYRRGMHFAQPCVWGAGLEINLFRSEMVFGEVIEP